MKRKYSISNLIIDYQNTAHHVVEIFQNKFHVDDILEGWHSGKYEQTGKLIDDGLKFYAFHGIGIAAHFDNKMIDFDFAYMPEQRHDGFDLWRLSSFVESQPTKYAEFLINDTLKSEFNNLKNENFISNPKTECQTNLYFWTADLTQNQIKDNQSLPNVRTKSWWKFWQ